MDRDEIIEHLDAVHERVSDADLFGHLQNDHGHETLPDFPTLGQYDRGFLTDMHLDDHFNEEYGG